jgi:iron complex transport system substrate-binding protein
MKKEIVMLKKLTAVFLSIGIMLSAFAACGPKNDISSGAGTQDYPVTIGEVTIKEKPTGAAVLSANIADVILAIGYETDLKAKSEECTQSDLSVLPNVTADDAEKIKSLGADLVLTETALTQEQNDAMGQAGITVLTIARATGREDLDRLYSEVGAALRGAKTGYERGKKISQSIFLTIDDISRIIPETDIPTSVAYLYDTDGGVVTGDTLEGKLIESAGLINAASDGTNNQMPVEDLLRVDPKYIFCPTGLKSQLAASSEYQKLTAVKEGRVYEMDPNLMLLQGCGMTDAVSFMAGTVYPELLNSSSSPSTDSSSSASSSASTSASSTASSSTSSNSSSSTSSAVGTYTTLKKDAQGEEVLKMQNRLQELGYMFLKPTGLYGDGTVQSVKDFQLLNGLTVTGVADPETLKKLYSPDAKKRTN